MKHLSLWTISVRFVAVVRVDGDLIAAAVVADELWVGWAEAAFRRFVVNAVDPSSILCLAGSFHCVACLGSVG